ncbi:Uncharacterised protein [Porphyromonas macacae]|uniref:Uncharacterized protein n=2 Tax=Porphyromonas macacae TaxID=28115 RepID=A0A379DHB8_9PORP|nr:hypothetical protein [Porphyromonas macacae]SUB77790.1 Uncharacterised protein [Porphyromonas macacae]
MMKRHKHRHCMRSILHYFVMVAFFAYYAGVTLFVHHHIVNGILITHSHPYNIFRAEGSDHTHTQEEITTIDLLMHLQALMPLVTAPLYVLLGAISILFISKAIRRGFGSFTRTDNLRGPPPAFSFC